MNCEITKNNDDWNMKVSADETPTEECGEIVCHCNVKENAELIAKIMDYDVESKVCTEVVEVKHGEWKIEMEYGAEVYICSECGFESANNSNFCPDCGADMRGK